VGVSGGSMALGPSIGEGFTHWKPPAGSTVEVVSEGHWKLFTPR
jgi:hypothetical protein